MRYSEGLSSHMAHFLDTIVLSLALICHTHTFEEPTIIPDRLHFQILFADIRMRKVWKFLASQPQLAKSVRSIKLSSRSIIKAEDLPPVLSGLAETAPQHVPVSNRDIAFLKSAVLHMSLLKEISWSYLSRISPQQLIDISHALTTSAHCLEGLSINLFHLKTIIRDQQQMKRLSIWSLTSLKRVALRSQSPSPDAIRMILSCPDIEDLYSCATSHSNTFPFYMMQQANWTKLRRLWLQPLFLSNGEERGMDIPAIITSFFVRHPNIECLYFGVSSDTPVPTLPPSSLPKLRSLSTSSLTMVTFLLSKSVISRLVHLTCTVAYFDNNTLPQMDKLESLCLFANGLNGPDLIHLFLSRAPNLKKISLSIRKKEVPDPSNWGCIRTKWPVRLWDKDAQDQYTELFLKYPQSKLTHIYIGSPLITGGDHDSVKIQIGTLCEKLSALQALKYVHVNPDHVELERDENGAYSGYHFLSHGDTEYSSSWGGFFSDF
ncbi:hypothetical protein Clacol_010428 [Clathrus columnatus]|uniref:Uncharacterized protein n=1 Tax=Clathrus columnatus TaxID=1419009 RepID=A0AAV5AT15_9AGAM|nr:hypothetical protein Clacol_010428 [Clathrus columnatus]